MIVRAALGLVTLGAACGEGSREHAASSRAAADSARADSIALATLPPSLDSAFAIRGALTPAALRDTVATRCDPLEAPNAPEARRRLRVRLADSSRSVLYVRAARDGEMLRVELVRRDRSGAQRGFIWEASTDTVQSLVWAPGATRAEVTTLPRGGPVPRALRALGRRLLALRCERRPFGPGRRPRGLPPGATPQRITSTDGAQ